MSLYLSQGRVPAWIICWLCDGCVVHMFWVCGRYALDMLWVCGMYGGSGCGYVVVVEEVVGISPGACDRQSVVVVVVERAPIVTPGPLPHPHHHNHILNLNNP